jgi:hypothetical protein
MIKSYIMLRASGNGTEESPFGPRLQDLAPYNVLRWNDVTGRAGDALTQMTDPRVVVIEAYLEDADAQAMAGDNKLWMIISQQVDEDGTVLSSNANSVYPSGERSTRIAQLAQITGFDAQKISNWWIEGRTRAQVANKIRNYA